MSALGAKLRKAEGGRVSYWCPGCDMAHVLVVNPPEGWTGPCWSFNENLDAPSFSPSVLVQWETAHPPVTSENLAEWKRQPWPQTRRLNVCHAFVTDGNIHFLNDCTHALTGRMVPLPDFGVMQ